MNISILFRILQLYSLSIDFSIIPLFIPLLYIQISYFSLTDVCSAPIWYIYSFCSIFKKSTLIIIHYSLIQHFGNCTKKREGWIPHWIFVYATGPLLVIGDIEVNTKIFKKKPPLLLLSCLTFLSFVCWSWTIAVLWWLRTRRNSKLTRWPISRHSANNSLKIKLAVSLIYVQNFFP